MIQPSPTTRRPDDLRGAVFMIVAAVSFAISFSLLKDLTVTLPQPVLMLFRGLVALMCFTPLIARRGLRLLATANPIGHLWRSALGFSAYYMFVAALALLPLGDAVAYSFTSPLWSILFGALVFGDRLSWRFGVTVSTGALGVTLIAAPSGAFGLGMALALGNALLGASAMVALKHLTAAEPPDRITFYFTLFTTLASLLLSLFDWKTPDAREALALIGTGVTFYIGQQCMTRAYLHGTFSRVAPLDFVRLPVSVAIGYVYFAEIPSWVALLGMVLVTASAIDTLLTARKPKDSR